MNLPPFATRWNLAAIEPAYERWRHDPASVDEGWRLFFEGFELGTSISAGNANLLIGPVESPGSPSQVSSPSQQIDIVRLIDAYRDLGHFLAHLDPLGDKKSSYPLLELSGF